MSDDAAAGGGTMPPMGLLDARRAAEVLSVDPSGIGGILLRARPGELRDQWLARVRSLRGQEKFVRLPLKVDDARLLGGLDLVATLAAGRPIGEPGLLAQADGGLILLMMAERIERALAARICGVMDTGSIASAHDGSVTRAPARFGLVALDESCEIDEQVPDALRERLGIHLDLSAFPNQHLPDSPCDGVAIAHARQALLNIWLTDEQREALVAAADACGIVSVRAVGFASRVARIAAALGARSAVTHEDLELAGRLVFALRVRRWPQQAADDSAAEPDPGNAGETSQTSVEGDDVATDQGDSEAGPLADVVAAAAAASLPAHLLAQLRDGVTRGVPRVAGRAGAANRSTLRGRPLASRPGSLASGARLSVLDTLRAAAPWQTLRRARSRDSATARSRIAVRKQDFRIQRFKQRSQSTSIFVVDASGSAALHRLAEVKGAVELLLAECYVRRDQVALIIFRGRKAETLLPPTRSLVRAKRGLAALPGGGTTPLASGIAAALDLAVGIRRRGGSPRIVLFTDGQANVCRDGSTGRPKAREDARHAASAVRATSVPAMVIDTATRPQTDAQALAKSMAAEYLPLPYANSERLFDAVRTMAPHRPK